MLKNILLAAAIVALLTCNLQAQSSSKKGSSSRSSSNSYAASAAKKERAMKKEIDKMANKIERTEFSGIKLNKEQRGVLKSLTETNFQQITNMTNQIGQMIPSNMLSKLKRTYKSAIKSGKSEKDAMVASMKKIELPEATQEKILMISDSKTQLMTKITMGVKDTLTTEQTTMLAEKMAMKEAKKAEAMKEKEAKAMASKEVMTSDDKMEKTTTGSGSKAGSGVKTGSGSK